MKLNGKSVLCNVAIREERALKKGSFDLPNYITNSAIRRWLYAAAQRGEIDEKFSIYY